MSKQQVSAADVVELVLSASEAAATEAATTVTAQQPTETHLFVCVCVCVYLRFQRERQAFELEPLERAVVVSCEHDESLALEVAL